ncbi:MAG: hypothetical protein EAZ06_07445 [Cytophagales bacterium]|nr:MAG: hypothetical protein EAZ06_07445 [Cytophagales bacterium]
MYVHSFKLNQIAEFLYNFDGQRFPIQDWFTFSNFFYFTLGIKQPIIGESEDFSKLSQMMSDRSNDNLCK